MTSGRIGRKAVYYLLGKSHQTCRLV